MINTLDVKIGRMYFKMPVWKIAKELDMPINIVQFCLTNYLRYKNFFKLEMVK